ncbi:hypothetical protein CFC21_093768, partial [Triticum aestivum]
MAMAPTASAVSFSARPSTVRPRAASASASAGAGRVPAGTPPGRQVVGAAGRLVREGRLHRARGAGGGRGGEAREVLRGRPDGGEGAAAAGPDVGDGELPRRHVPLRHRLPPRPLLL